MDAQTVTLTLTKLQALELSSALQLRVVELAERKLSQGYTQADIQPFTDALNDIRRQFNEQYQHTS